MENASLYRALPVRVKAYCCEPLRISTHMRERSVSMALRVIPFLHHNGASKSCICLRKRAGGKIGWMHIFRIGKQLASGSKPCSYRLPSVAPRYEPCPLENGSGSPWHAPLCVVLAC